MVPETRDPGGQVYPPGLRKQREGGASKGRGERTHAVGNRMQGIGDLFVTVRTRLYGHAQTEFMKDGIPYRLI
jgi:hypothetical protein